MSTTRVLLASAVTVLALGGTPAIAATPQQLQGANLNAQGIIMRDGGVCDPIRHMGC